MLRILIITAAKLVHLRADASGDNSDFLVAHCALPQTGCFKKFGGLLAHLFNNVNCMIHGLKKLPPLPPHFAIFRVGGGCI